MAHPPAKGPITIPDHNDAKWMEFYASLPEWLQPSPAQSGDDFEQASNWAAGIGDAVSANFDKHMRRKWGFDSVVDYQSGDYKNGQEKGQVVNEALDTASPLAAENPWVAIPFALVKGIQFAGHSMDMQEALENGNNAEANKQAVAMITTALQMNAAMGAFANCFPAGTLVATLRGLRPIETIEPGEKVWAYDVVAGQWCASRVLQTLRRDYEGHSAFVTVAGETIESTLLHPYWVVGGEALQERPRKDHLPSVPNGATTPGRWVDAGDLRVGDELLLRDGRILPVQTVRITPYHGEVFNFAVEVLQCYAVGYNGVLVHNVNGEELGAPDTEDHHQLPQAQEFKDKFEGAGLDIEDYKIPLPKDVHRLKPDGLHTGAGEENWNGAWRQFFDTHENPSKQEILNQLEKMRGDFGLNK